jgi:hypothetical protein
VKPLGWDSQVWDVRVNMEDWQSEQIDMIVVRIRTGTWKDASPI